MEGLQKREPGQVLRKSLNVNWAKKRKKRGVGQGKGGGSKVDPGKLLALLAEAPHWERKGSPRIKLERGGNKELSCNDGGSNIGSNEKKKKPC